MALNYAKTNTFATGTTISSSAVNANFDDVVNAFGGLENLSKSLSNLLVDTVLRSSGTIQSAAGLVGTPAITFTADPDTGVYNSAANEFAIAAGGALIGKFASTGLVMNTLKLSGLSAGSTAGDSLRYEQLITTPTSYTPTFSAGWGTAASVKFQYQLIGKMLHIWGAFQAGTTAASIGTITLPATFTFDTANIDTSRNWVGNFIAFSAGANQQPYIAGTTAWAVYDGSHTDRFAMEDITNTNAWGSRNVSAWIGSSTFCAVDCWVPVT